MKSVDSCLRVLTASVKPSGSVMCSICHKPVLTTTRSGCLRALVLNAHMSVLKPCKTNYLRSGVASAWSVCAQNKHGHMAADLQSGCLQGILSDKFFEACKAD